MDSLGIFLVSAALAASACASEQAASGRTDGGATDAGASDGVEDSADARPAIPASSPECSGPTAGPAMAFLPGGFCIDRTEVTVAQYAAWIATAPSLETLPASCSFKTSFAVDKPGCTTDQTACKGDCSDTPQTCVDWCDAYAYCQAAGKHLCGRVGGGTVPWDKSNDITESQWFAACSAGGAFSYTYGTTYVKAACKDMYECCVVGPVADRATCQSPVAAYAGVFDLSGNAAEWEDGCQADTGPDDACRYRGGSVSTPAENTTMCGALSETLTRVVNRAGGGPDVGFRCCFDPL